MFLQNRGFRRHRGIVQKCKSAKEQKLKYRSERFQVKKCKPLQQGIKFIWPERNNILDFWALHFRIIKSSEDKVLIIIYILASRKPHTGTFQWHLIELMLIKAHLDIKILQLFHYILGYITIYTVLYIRNVIIHFFSLIWKYLSTIWKAFLINLNFILIFKKKTIFNPYGLE
jgi:hypothetical protein